MSLWKISGRVYLTVPVTICAIVTIIVALARHVDAAEGSGATNSNTEYYCDTNGDRTNDTGYQCDANGDGVSDSCFSCDTNGDGIPDSCYVDLNGDGVKLECPIRCGDYDLPPETVVSIVPPGKDVFDNIVGALKKCLIVQDCSATIAGMIEMKKGFKCCDSDAYTAPVA